MKQLNFPSYNFRFRDSENKKYIFDEIRKKFVVLTPEEWVRQHVVQFLVQEKKYPMSHINVEKLIKINTLNKRYDIVVFQLDGSIKLLIECKAPSVDISQTTFDQIAQYNLILSANYLMVTNGLKHYFCLINFQEQRYDFLRDLPNYFD
jgi:Type I restriction enzyme R protein N terminus (HSDR_N)